MPISQALISKSYSQGVGGTGGYPHGGLLPEVVLPLICGYPRHEELTLVRREVRHGALNKLAALPRSDLRKGHRDVEGVFVTAER